MWGFTPSHHVFTTQGAIVPKVQEAFAPYRGYKAPSREKKGTGVSCDFWLVNFCVCYCSSCCCSFLSFPVFSCDFFCCMFFFNCNCICSCVCCCGGGRRHSSSCSLLFFYLLFIVVVVVLFFLKRFLNIKQLILRVSKTRPSRWELRSRSRGCFWGEKYFQKQQLSSDDEPWLVVLYIIGI